MYKFINSLNRFGNNYVFQYSTIVEKYSDILSTIRLVVRFRTEKREILLRLESGEERLRLIITRIDLPEDTLFYELVGNIVIRACQFCKDEYIPLSVDLDLPYRELIFNVAETVGVELAGVTKEEKRVSDLEH